jgi:hypothetical protein
VPREHRAGEEHVLAEALLEAEIEHVRRLGHIQNVPPVGFSPN